MNIHRILNYIPMILGFAFAAISPLIYHTPTMGIIGAVSGAFAGFCFTAYLELRDEV